MDKPEDGAVVIPETLQEFLREIGKESLVHDFRMGFGIDPPEYILSNPGQLRRAGEEWRTNLKTPIQWFARAAERALVYLPRDLVQANVNFVSDIQSLPGVDEFLSKPRQLYIVKLIAATCSDPKRFSHILKIFTQLKQ